MFAIGRAFGTALAAFALTAGAMAQDTALETRLGEKGFESPPVSLEQIDWLVGQWAGEGIRGAPAMESWLPPIGGTMVGTFVQETDDGTIMFTEHLYLMEEEDSLILRLKHFNADLTSWEEKDDMLAFRLVAAGPCALFFHGLTLRCAQADQPGEGLVAAVRMQSDKPEPQELVFRFGRSQSVQRGHDCDGTTLEMNDCLAAILERAKARQAQYLEAAIGRDDNPIVLGTMIRESDTTFAAYRDAECNAVYENWKAGTIRNAMWLRCAIRLTDQRTHDIWRSWLTYQDSSEPILPEPKPIR